MDEILLNKTQKVSATNHEAPEFMDSGYNANNVYQVDKISLEDTKEKLDWCKCAFEYENKNSYGIENRNYMTRIHNNEVNNIDECNLMHDIINPPKRAKKINIRYATILHGCMNNRKYKARFKKILILLDGWCSSKILMGRIFEKLILEEYYPMQWHTQAVNITTNLKVKVYFTLPTLIATNEETWKCHVDDSVRGRYDMIIWRDILI